MQIVTLTTDYGTRDYYVAALKGVILRMAPQVRLVDISHEIEPYNVASGAFVLWQACRWFPAGTVHLAVVDPGVGTARRIIVGRFAGQLVVAPDNGLVTFLHQDLPADAVHLVENQRFFLPEVSSTFHGRDIMAPVAAHLANGVEPREFGPVMDRLDVLALPHRAELKPGAIEGRVLYADRFGTLITNIAGDQLPAPARVGAGLRVEVGGVDAGPVRSTFGEGVPGELVALVGGAGLLEIAVNRGRAVDRFGVAATVRVVQD